MGSKRSRSALSPTRQESALPPEFPRAMWETEKPTVGPHKWPQNPTLAMAQGMRVQQEKQPLNSFVWFGLPTLGPAKRSSPTPTGFGEFLQACRWCRKKIGDNSHIYMYGYLGAFCTPECRENLIKLDMFVDKRIQNQVGLTRERNMLRKDNPM